LRGDVAGDDLGAEASGRLEAAPIDHLEVDEEGHPLGTTEVEVIADGGFEPSPGPARPVEYRRVGDFELGQ
jgi:hypothetical protein